jgi:pyruvate/2-oxoglutarate dehydrogenase complex dihydrolipoamide dehydrogenase (E3) component
MFRISHFPLFVKGSVWNRLGSKVTVVEFTDAIAAGADGEIAYAMLTIQEHLVSLSLSLSLSLSNAFHFTFDW